MKLNHNQQLTKNQSINQDINNYIDNLDEKLEPTEQLSLITTYIQKNNYELTVEEYISLVQNNPRLTNILELITTELSKSSSHSFKTPILTQHSEAFIDAYCLINDVFLDNDPFVLKKELEYLNNKNTDNISTNPYLAYIEQITRPQLTKEQEKELFLSLTTESPEKQKQIKQEIIERNLMLVIKIAKFYPDLNNDSFFDIIQEGNIGLMHAIDKFDVNKNCKFSTYASLWIKEAISRYLVNQTSLIRTPVYAHYKNKKLSQQNNNNDSTKPLLKYPEYQVISVHSINHQPQNHDLDNYSLDPDSCSLISSYYDLIPDPGSSVEDSAIEQIMQKEVRNLITSCNLSSKFTDILERRYGFNNTPLESLSQIAKKENITKEGVRVREKQLLAELARKEGIEKLAYYMEEPYQALQNLPEKRRVKKCQPKKTKE